MLQGLSSCNPGGRVQVQQLVKQVVGLIRDSVPAPLIFLHLAGCLWVVFSKISGFWVPRFFLVVCLSLICSVFVLLVCSYSGTMRWRFILNFGRNVFIGFRNWSDFIIWWPPLPPQHLTQRPEVLPRQLSTTHHSFTWKKKSKMSNIICTI